MNSKEFNQYKQDFIKAFRAVLREKGITDELTKAAFCAYADTNPLIRFLFWRRLWVTLKYAEEYSSIDAVLDFGCGSGVTLPLLTPLAKRVVGVDINMEPHTDIARYISFPKQAEIYETSKMPLANFADNTFDMVIALDVLEHVDDLIGIGRELSRIIKPCGSIVISGPTENFFYQIGRKIAGSEYTGNYHVRNVYDIKREFQKLMKIETLATLYYPMPLFKIYIAKVGK
jgi:2-polyprenyl-3-methyl-5-hydroxy-6-metoxy-1,4-benzoquinol methylase